MIPQNIILKYGLEGIPFGITEKELIKKIGKFITQSEIEYSKENKDIIYNYFGISFYFNEAYLYRLNQIEFEDKSYKIGNKELIEKTLHVFLDEMQELEIESPKIEVQINEYTDNTIFLFYESVGLTAIFEDYLCKSVSIYPIYDEEDKIIWPN
jgi:hypothetical protein